MYLNPFVGTLKTSSKDIVQHVKFTNPITPYKEITCYIDTYHSCWNLCQSVINGSIKIGKAFIHPSMTLEMYPHGTDCNSSLLFHPQGSHAAFPASFCSCKM